VNPLEGLIIIALVLFFFKAIAKRAKELQDARQTYGAKSVPISQNVPHERVRQPEKPLTELESVTEGAAYYQPIQPMVMADSVQKSYQGSLGSPTKEGTSSTEGMDTCDPSLAHDRSTVMEAYVIHDEEKAATEILPQLTDTNAWVQAFVMNEILNRPYKWGGNRG